MNKRGTLFNEYKDYNMWDFIQMISSNYSFFRLFLIILFVIVLL